MKRISLETGFGEFTEIYKDVNCYNINLYIRLVYVDEG